MMAKSAMADRASAEEKIQKIDREGRFEKSPSSIPGKVPGSTAQPDNAPFSDGSGRPWLTEPDRLSGIDEATEYATQITRGPGGHLCGYVGIPHDHPWFGKGYSDQVSVPREVIERPIDVDKVGAINLFCAAASADAIAAGTLDIVLAIDVHGGLTYASAKAPGSVIEGLWWFGFDCAHAGDLTPSYAERYGGAMQYGVYRDIGFVQAEVASLARQLAAVDLSPRSARHG